MKTIQISLLLLLLNFNTHANELRLVSLAPHLTEWVYALGAEKQLVAVSDFSDYPEQAKSLPRVASHQGVDFEAIMRLQPDLILAWKGGNKPQDLTRLESLGFRIFYSQPKRPEDISQELVKLAAKIGKTNIAENLALNFDKALSNIRNRYQQQQSLPVFYYLWGKPLMSVGPNAWATHLLNICHADNIFADAISDYPEVPVEQVLLRQPKRIIAAIKGDKEQLQQPWLQHGFTQQQFLQVNPDVLHRFTPRLIEGIQYLCEQIHSLQRADTNLVSSMVEQTTGVPD